MQLSSLATYRNINRKMAFDNYTIWEPITDLPNSPYFFELHDSKGTLDVFLKEFSEPKKTLKIGFSGKLAYRLVNEAGRLKTLNESSIMTFCTSTNSEFLVWFKQESEGIFDDWALTHFVICNSDSIIDVISSKQPEFEWQIV